MWNKASFLISSVFNIALDSLLQNKRKAYKRKDGVKPSLPADGVTTSAEHPDGGIPLLTTSDTRRAVGKERPVPSVKLEDRLCLQKT